MYHLRFEKYKDNEPKYVKHHQQLANFFQKECERLLLAFTLEKKLNFETFAELWIDKHFSSIFSGMNPGDQLEIFMTSCFSIIKKFIIFSKNIYIQTGALYTLYGVYYKQPMRPKVKIRCTVQVFKRLKKLVAKLKRRRLNDGVFIFKLLKLDGAFKCTPLHNEYGPDYRFVRQELELVNNIFEPLKKGDPTMLVEAILNSRTFNGLDVILNVTKDYVKRLKTFAFSEEDCKITAKIPEEIEDLLGKILSVGFNEVSSKENTICKRSKKKGSSTPKQLNNKVPESFTHKQLNMKILGRFTPKQLNLKVLGSFTSKQLNMKVLGSFTPEQLNNKVPESFTHKQLNNKVPGNFTPRHLNNEVAGSFTHKHLNNKVPGNFTPKQLNNEVLGSFTHKHLNNKVPGNFTHKHLNNKVPGSFTLKQLNKVPGSFTLIQLNNKVPGSFTPEQLNNKVLGSFTYKHLNNKVSGSFTPKQLNNKVNTTAKQLKEKAFRAKVKPFMDTK